MGGTCAQWGGGGDTDTSPTPQSPPVSPCSYLPRSNIYHVVTAGGLGQSLQQLQGEESFGGCSRRGGVTTGCRERGSTHLPQAPDLMLLFGLDVAAEQGMQAGTLAGGALGPPRAPAGEGEGAGGSGKGQEGEGPGGPRPPRAPQEPSQLRGGGGGKGGLPGRGELRPQPLGEEVLWGCGG